MDKDMITPMYAVVSLLRYDISRLYSVKQMVKTYETTMGEFYSKGGIYEKEVAPLMNGITRFSLCVDFYFREIEHPFKENTSVRNS